MPLGFVEKESFIRMEKLSGEGFSVGFVPPGEGLEEGAGAASVSCNGAA
jgi:hypothetical protein